LHIHIGIDGTEGGAAAVREVGSRVGTQVQELADRRLPIVDGESFPIEIPPLTPSECGMTTERREAL